VNFGAILVTFGELTGAVPIDTTPPCRTPP
jgi:hypothetical protein